MPQVILSLIETSVATSYPGSTPAPLVNAGHVSPRIWEIEFFLLLGWLGFASRKYEHVAIQVSYKGSCKQSIPANVTRRRLLD